MLTMRKLSLNIVIGFLLMSNNIAAQEIITIESQVTGSKEQPKLITIVPWREAGEPGYYGKDITGLDQADVQFKAMNRSDFIQEVKYIKALRSN